MDYALEFELSLSLECIDRRLEFYTRRRARLLREFRPEILTERESRINQTTTLYFPYLRVRVDYYISRM